MTLSTESAAAEEIDLGLWRETIDDLDTQIIDLIRVRVAQARALQSAKIRVGLPRVDLGREREVREHYREELGVLTAAVIAGGILDAGRKQI